MRSLSPGPQATAVRLLPIVVFAFACAPAEERLQEAPQAAVDLTFGQEIPLRDGVKLNATIYRPSDQTEPLPVAVTMTPYISDTYHERGMYFARHGYAYAIVDVRGRGTSEGKFHPFANDAQDGHDVVEWLARQPWSTGQVATWGGSYAGTNQ